jgi:hypothetical protein
MSKVLFKGEYSCDGGSIRLFSKDFAVCFTNDFGDGTHPVTVVEGMAHSPGDFKGSIEVLDDDSVFISSYDCSDDEIFTLPKGRYGVTANEGAITIAKWE